MYTSTELKIAFYHRRCVVCFVIVRQVYGLVAVLCTCCYIQYRRERLRDVALYCMDYDSVFATSYQKKGSTPAH